MERQWPAGQRERKVRTSIDLAAAVTYPVRFAVLIALVEAAVALWSVSRPQRSIGQRARHTPEYVGGVPHLHDVAEGVVLRRWRLGVELVVVHFQQLPRPHTRALARLKARRDLLGGLRAASRTPSDRSIPKR